jgi:hypothetical protein
MALVWALLLLYICQLCSCTPLTIAVAPKEKTCFYEDIVAGEEHSFLDTLLPVAAPYLYRSMLLNAALQLQRLTTPAKSDRKPDLEVPPTDSASRAIPLHRLRRR